MVVRFSADVYTVDEVKGKDPLGLRVYFLLDKHGMDVKTADGKRKLFKGSELLKVFPNKDGVFEEYLTQQQVNMLNGVSEEDLVEEDEEKNVPEKTKEKKKIERDILEDPFGKWRIQHWRKALIGKEFEDEGTRWHITDVTPQPQSESYYYTYNIHYADNDGTETFTYLPWLFSEKFLGVRKEEWFQRRKKDYDSLADPEYRKDAPVEVFEAGAVVYAWWWDTKKQNRKFKATVEKVNENGTYDIVYHDDGKSEKEVKSIYMTRADEKRKKPTKKTRRKVVSKSSKTTLRGKRRS